MSIIHDFKAIADGLKAVERPAKAKGLLRVNDNSGAWAYPLVCRKCGYESNVPDCPGCGHDKRE